MNSSRISFVSGAAGFVGGHLTKRLSELGSRVGGIGHGELSPQNVAASGMSTWIGGDVTRDNLDRLALELGMPDCIFHLAGGSSVATSMSAPCADFAKTCVSTSELLEWTRLNSPLTKVLFVSSAAVYGNRHSSKITENSLLQPYSIYGVNKRIAESLFESYAECFGIQVAIVRLFSVYGPGLRKQLLWDICSKLCRNADMLQLGGNGKEMRDWIHVRDAVEVMLSAMQGASRDVLIVNGGTGIGTNVETIATQLSYEFTGKDVRIEFTGAKRAGDPDYLVANIQRLLELEGGAFQEVTAGLREFASWFKQENSIQ